MCFRCRSNLTLCAECRLPLTEENVMRNRGLENLASTMALTFPCKYRDEGCQFKDKYYEISAHEKICHHQAFPCPLSKEVCSWKGNVGSLKAHLIAHHGGIPQTTGQNAICIIEGIMDRVNARHSIIMECYGHNFLVFIQKVLDKFSAIVLLMGSHEDAGKFMYRFELCGEDQRLTWEAVVKSVNSDINELFIKHKCFSFNSGILIQFTKGGKLAIPVTIVQV